MSRIYKENFTLHLTGRDLKWIACICMLADHIAKGFSLKGASFVILSDLIGRITFPIFCMLLAEGFFHTRSRSRYFFRVLILALLSEIPFDLLFSDRAMDWSGQNTCFTLMLGLLMFTALQAIRNRRATDYRISAFLQICIVLVFCAVSMVMHADYGANGIAALAVFYYGLTPSEPAVADSSRKVSESATGSHDISRNSLPDNFLQSKRGLAAVFACLSLNIYHFYNAGAFLALIPLSRYNGKRGMSSVTAKYAFYLFYPLHLLLLVLLRYYLR